MSAAKRILAEIQFGEGVDFATSNHYFRPKGGKQGAMFDPTKPLKLKQILMADLHAMGANGTELHKMFGKPSFSKAALQAGKHYNGGGYALKVLRDPRMKGRELETKIDILAQAKELMKSASLKAAENIVEKVAEGDYRASCYLLESVMPKAPTVGTINNIGPVDFGSFLAMAAQSKTSMHEISNQPIDVTPIEGERIG